MRAYQSFYEAHRDKADIYLVYILEAHFVEKDASGNYLSGWPIGYQYNYPQTKTMEERKAMVELMLDEYHPTIPVLIDQMDNAFQNAYHPWPDRAVAFVDGVLRYISMVDDNGSRPCPWTDEIERLMPTWA